MFSSWPSFKCLYKTTPSHPVNLNASPVMQPKIFMGQSAEEAHKELDNMALSSVVLNIYHSLFLIAQMKFIALQGADLSFDKLCPVARLHSNNNRSTMNNNNSNIDQKFKVQNSETKLENQEPERSGKQHYNS